MIYKQKQQLEADMTLREHSILYSAIASVSEPARPHGGVSDD